jgi:hypothetical protein
MNPILLHLKNGGKPSNDKGLRKYSAQKSSFKHSGSLPNPSDKIKYDPATGEVTDLDYKWDPDTGNPSYAPRYYVSGDVLKRSGVHSPATGVRTDQYFNLASKQEPIIDPPPKREEKPVFPKLSIDATGMIKVKDGVWANQSFQLPDDHPVSQKYRPSVLRRQSSQTLHDGWALDDIDEEDAPSVLEWLQSKFEKPRDAINMRNKEIADSYEQEAVPKFRGGDSLKRVIDYTKEAAKSIPTMNFPSEGAGSSTAATTNSTGRGIADYANLALGAYGLASTLSAKKPTLERPRDYRSVIKPATGDETLLTNTNNAIASGANTARRNLRQYAGSNTSGYVQGALAINDQENKARTQALGTNAAIYRGEQDRVYGQLNADKQFNHNAKRQYDEAMYSQKLNEWAGRQQQGQAMLQNSLNYEQQRSADIANKGVAERQANQRVDLMGEGMLYDQATKLVINGDFPSVAAAMEHLRQTKAGGLDKYKTFNYQGKRRYGGLVKR